MSNRSCAIVKSKYWPYDQYYLGKKDDENRRKNDGENHWTGAKSLERYSGRFLRDTMHGAGEYYWRYNDRDGAFMTYEGHFYCNELHGYGTMSYPDGRVFDGLFYSNIRWGPGIESHVHVRQNVGLWLGNQLVRLAWVPPTYSLILDLTSTSTGRACVDTQRVVMTTCSETIYKNSEVELLAQYGSAPQSTGDKWMKLYPKHCTDITSAVFRKQLFDDVYYGAGKKNILIEIKKMLEITKPIEGYKMYFAWNNNEIIKHMMKHTFMHESQRPKTGLNISNILSESRKKLKQPAKHELDCRTLLMASYLGRTDIVVRLINDEGIHPDVADMQGNSALMYAVCGDHTEIIHFLVEAGASIDNYNDCCCTALGIALIRYICVSKEITASEMTQALIPETNMPQKASLENVVEWNLGRDISSPYKSNILTKIPSKTMKPQISHKKIKSLISLKDVSPPNQLKRNVTSFSEKVHDQSYVVGNEDINKSFELFTTVLGEYVANVADQYLAPSAGNPIPYVFEVKDITDEIIDNEIEEQKKIIDKNPKKVLVTQKETIKTLNETQPSKIIADSTNFTERSGPDRCQRIIMTISQLLLEGADPGLIRCPQTALFMGVSSGNSHLVKLLIDHGANLNEFYPYVLGYTALDIAISYQLTIENLNVIRALLESGADTRHRLPYHPRNSNDSLLPGPTLLHAVLSKTVDKESDEEIRRKLLGLLLTYNCNPVAQYNGRSAIDIAMTKGADLFEVFIKHSKVDLNAVINQSNQNILTKMFTLPFFKTFENQQRLLILTDLLVHGADPLRASQSENEKFENIFVFASKFLVGSESVETKRSPSVTKHESKVKKNGKTTDDKATKQKTMIGDIEEYKQALELVRDWARLTLIRSLRGKIVKKLFKIINRYKHRHWTMIIKEVKTKRHINLWLTTQACLEICTVLKTTNKKVYNDKKVLKYLLCIVIYCCRNFNESSDDVRICATEKSIIEKEVYILLQKYNTVMLTEVNYYTITELTEKDDIKYNVCFDCALPLKDEKIICPLCQNVSFCSYDCMKLNIDRINKDHPCSDNFEIYVFPKFQLRSGRLSKLIFCILFIAT